MNVSEIAGWIVAILGTTGLGAVVSGFWTRRKIASEASKNGADAAQVLSAASVALLTPMQQQLTLLGEQLTRSQLSVDHLDGRLRQTTRDLALANDQLAMCTTRVTELTDQLQYYRDKYGPPTDELQRIRP